MNLLQRDDQPGPIVGSGPGFARAMRLHSKREAERKRVGKWRKSPTPWKRDDGSYIDPDWYVVNY